MFTAITVTRTLLHAVMATPAGRNEALFGLNVSWLNMIFPAARPSIYGASSFWTSSPTWFAIRIGVLMMGLAAVYACARVAGRFGMRAEPLARLGRSSLFVYWIHVELVYGFATKPLHGQLPLWGTAIGFGICALVMYGAMEVRDRLVAAWRRRIHHLFAAPAALGE